MSLTPLVKNIISNNIFAILSLASEGCPPIDTSLSIYNDLEEFAYSINDATEEEIKYVRQEINKFIPGFIDYYDADFDTYKDCLIYFFNDEHTNTLNTFLFGKILLDALNKSHISEEPRYVQ